MNKRWTSYNSSMKNLRLLMDEFRIPEIIARTMINRGIDTVEKARIFLNADMRCLYDPYMLKGMEKAVERISGAIERKERICVYGDYDVDGITSTAIMIKTFNKLGADATYFIPNRIEEGYGLNISSMERIRKLGVSLLVTVDCGIKSVEAVEHAKKMGMDVVITDHHECEGELPGAVSIINPHQPECGYPNKFLAGVGVAFKLAKALLERAVSGDYADEFIDIVSIGTIADVVPLLDENRIIVKNGLRKIENTKNEGIKALLEVCGLRGKELNAYNVAFMLAPRINAAGRIADSKECVELLLTDNQARAMEIARKLDSDNRERQAIENGILNDAIAIIENTIDMEKERALVLSGENWHIGVVGIVASRLAERYYLPAFIMSQDGEYCKGSARSIPGFNLFEAMSRHRDLFEKFGGHEMAAGFTIRKEKVEELRMCMNDEADKAFRGEKPVPEILVDYRLEPKDICLDTVRHVKLLEPFGTGNASPVFVYRGLKVLSSRPVGNDLKHLSMTVHDGTNEIKCIAYNMGSMQKLLSIGRKIDIICSVESNVWNGIESVQLNIKDFRLSK